MALPLVAAAGSILPSLFGLIDDLFTSDAERAEAKRKLVELEQQGRLAQIAVNAAEAKHDSVFVAGWRPAIGWLCGLILAWVFIVRDFIVLALTIAAPDFDVSRLPNPDLGMVITILGGMLGLGALRTTEKLRGVSRGGGRQRPMAPVAEPGDRRGGFKR
ncbi:3TM-type holin [Pikeienuella sp. HZG-20]|uniref:3TM-type holin n=1 Tax=Paludibacillus litoralis TaxID=3133267 RepID=UPI0030EDE091